MSDILRLAELLRARLWLDLSGPLGELIGVLEIAPGRRGADHGRVGTAPEAVARRLGPGRRSVGPDTLQRPHSGPFAGNRPVRLDLGGLAPGTTLPPLEARLVLNVVPLAAKNLPGGPGRAGLSAVQPFI